MGNLQLHRAKEQLMGQLAMSEENNLSFMLMMGKSLIDLQYIPQLDEIFKNIKDITAHQLMDIANEMFDESRLSVLSYHPN